MAPVMEYPVAGALGIASLTLGLWLAYRLAGGGESADDSRPTLLVVLGYGDSGAAYTLYSAGFTLLSLYIGLATVAWIAAVASFDYVIEAMGVGVLSFSIYIGLLGVLATDPGEQLTVRTYGDTAEFTGHTWYRRWVYSLFGLVGTVLSGIMIGLTDGLLDLI